MSVSRVKKFGLFFVLTLIFGGMVSLYSMLEPNIMILFDNSGSMNTIMFPPGYDPGFEYLGPPTDPIDPEYVYLATKIGNQYYLTADSYQIELQSTPDTDVMVLNLPDSDPWDSFTPNQEIYFYTAKYNGQEVRYPGTLLNYLLYFATQSEIDQWNHFIKYGQWEMENHQRDDFRKVRIRALAQALKEAVTGVYEDFDAGISGPPRIGLFHFDFDDGAHVILPSNQSVSLSSMKSIIDGIPADAWSPLSEAFAEVWALFRHGGTQSLQDPTCFLSLEDPACQIITSNTPIEHWRQKNVIFILTDGESSQDLGLRDLPPEALFFTPENTAPWGDTDDISIEDDTLTLEFNGTHYLDDLAYFAFQHDLWPDGCQAVHEDPRFETLMVNKQTIRTYVMSISEQPNLHKDTALNGGGEFYPVSDFDQMVNQLTHAFQHIRSSDKQLIGSWDGMGVWKRDNRTLEWSRITPEMAHQLEAGDMNGDGVDDLLGWWDSGIWVRYEEGIWDRIIGTENLIDLTLGDINGDGFDDLVGSWSHGIWLRDSESQNWIRIHSTPPTQLVAGNFLGSPGDDLIGVWSHGIWYYDVIGDYWEKIIGSEGIIHLAVGDMNGDGADDLVTSWTHGVWWKDMKNGGWERLHDSALHVAAQDINLRGVDDLIGVWEGTPGIWIFLSETGKWQKAHPLSPTCLTTGELR